MELSNQDALLLLLGKLVYESVRMVATTFAMMMVFVFVLLLFFLLLTCFIKDPPKKLSDDRSP